MKTKYLLLPFISLFALFFDTPQAAAQDYFPDCNFSPLIIVADKKPAFIDKKGLTLEDFVIKEIGKKAKKYDGKIYVEILVDLNGNTCCRSIVNKTYSDIKPLNLLGLVKKTGVWMPAEKGGKKVNSNCIIVMNFKKGVLEVNKEKY